MRTTQHHTILPTIMKTWPKISHFLTVPSTKNAYIEACHTLDTLIDIIRENEKHPLASLAETLGILVKEYEDEHHPLPLTTAKDALRFLMKEHHLTQKDLPEIGSQGVVSEILSGKRALNIRQIRALSRRFHLPSSVFVGI